MIKKLKIKFITLSMTSLFALLAIIIISMNIINYSTVIGEADDILSLLSHNRGRFPEHENTDVIPGIDIKENDMSPRPSNDFLPHHMSPELPYASRYFSVLLDPDGKVAFTDISHIASVDSELAKEYALSVQDDSKDRGFIGNYRFIKYAENDSVRVTFLDCENQLDSFKTFLYTSIIIALCGFTAVFLVMFFIAGKIIRPIAESYEKQKRFITDAGHEIKTPLTIINANVDILEMETGENESLTEIRNQSKRLTKLTNDLTYLAKMEEPNSPMTMIEFPISEVVQKSAEAFKSLAAIQNKTIDLKIMPLLTVKGNDSAISQLVSILLDNAVKYSPEGSTITLSLCEQGRGVILSVSNPTEYLIEQKHLNQVFDRFFRMDASRNSSTGGHGIGLSVAKAIVVSHGGKITASADDKHSFRIDVVFSQ